MHRLLIHYLKSKYNSLQRKREHILISFQQSKVIQLLPHSNGEETTIDLEYNWLTEAYSWSKAKAVSTGFKHPKINCF